MWGKICRDCEVEQDNCIKWKCTQRGFPTHHHHHRRSTSCVYRIYQLWIKSPLISKHVKSVSFSISCHQAKCSSQVHKNVMSLLFPPHSLKFKYEKSVATAAERWKIAYQIEAIRLNCSHKYCFSHALVYYRVDRSLSLSLLVMSFAELQCVDFANNFFLCVF